MSRTSKSATTPEDPKTPTPSSTTTITPPTWPMSSENEGYMVFFARGDKEGEWKPTKIWYLSTEGAQPLKGTWSKTVKWPPKNGVAWWISLMSSSPCLEDDDSLPLELDMKLQREGDSAMLVRSYEGSDPSTSTKGSDSEK